MANWYDDDHIIEIGDQRQPSSSDPAIQRTSSSSSSHWNPFESGFWLSLQFILSVIQIVASITVLLTSKLNGGNPDRKLFSWVLGYACGCFLMLPLLCCRYLVRGTLNLLRYGIVEVMKMSLSCFFLVWFVLGGVWVFGTSFSGKDNAKLETLCLVFLASGCIMYSLPVMKFGTLCMLLPCLILPVLTSQQDQLGRGGANPADGYSSINALPTYKFKENGESGVLAAGTDKERGISGEDAVCCICLGKYADNDEVRELPCNHFFHVECVDKWLKINARCPLCQYELPRAAAAPPLAIHSGPNRDETTDREPSRAWNPNLL